LHCKFDENLHRSIVNSMNTCIKSVLALQNQWESAWIKCLHCKINENLHRIKACTVKSMKTCMKSMIASQNQWKPTWHRCLHRKINANLHKNQCLNFKINEHLHKINACIAQLMETVIKSMFASQTQWQHVWNQCLHRKLNETCINQWNRWATN